MSKKLIVVIVLFSAIFLAGCKSQAPQIDLELQSFEFGDVVNGTIVGKDITITNRGSTPLIIDEVSTSCGCTTAAIDPTSVPPGESAVLHIEFDSGAHGPELTGELMRQVFMRTNDPKNPEVMVTFTANVTK